MVSHGLALKVLWPTLHSQDFRTRGYLGASAYISGIAIPILAGLAILLPVVAIVLDLMQKNVPRLVVWSIGGLAILNGAAWIYVCVRKNAAIIWWAPSAAPSPFLW
ncbi:hypothetical protein JCM16303_005699 [Sporobolomyces ruberrimus]